MCCISAFGDTFNLPRWYTRVACSPIWMDGLLSSCFGVIDTDSSHCTLTLGWPSCSHIWYSVVFSARGRAGLRSSLDGSLERSSTHAVRHRRILARASARRRCPRHRAARTMGDHVRMRVHYSSVILFLPQALMRCWQSSAYDIVWYKEQKHVHTDSMGMVLENWPLAESWSWTQGTGDLTLKRVQSRHSFSKTLYTVVRVLCTSVL